MELMRRMSISDFKTSAIYCLQLKKTKLVAENIDFYVLFVFILHWIDGSLKQFCCIYIYTTTIESSEYFCRQFFHLLTANQECYVS